MGERDTSGEQRDVVDRLRSFWAHSDYTPRPYLLAKEAADEITRLRSDLAAALSERNKFREIVNDFKTLARLPGRGPADKAKSRHRREVAFATLMTERDAALSRAEKAERERDRLREALRDLIPSARVLQENSRNCVRLHHHWEYALPPWLRDCEATIDAARAALSTGERVEPETSRP